MYLLYTPYEHRQQYTALNRHSTSGAKMHAFILDTDVVEDGRDSPEAIIGVHVSNFMRLSMSKHHHHRFVRGDWDMPLLYGNSVIVSSHHS